MTRLSAAVCALGVAVVVFGSVLTGCGGSNEADDSAALLGTRWVADEILGVGSVLPAQQGKATLVFKDGTAGGSGTINSYSASYETGPGNAVLFSPVASTLMAGPPEAMAQEAAYFAALEKAASYVVTADTLELRDGAGQVLIAFRAVEPIPLTGTEWRATAYNNGKGALQGLVPNSTITAVFAEDGTLSGNAGVNQYNTSWTVTPEGDMTIDPQIISTLMAGSEELMAQEAAYLAALPQTATYTIDDDGLWLRDANGAALAHFTAE